METHKHYALNLLSCLKKGCNDDDDDDDDDDYGSSQMCLFPYLWKRVLNEQLKL